ncbi:MAG: DUF3082 domain-containing protein [Synechococcales cyanobacterium RU_4_20]|nr:DUF3082 domain-containing protein [Synechococcales cyanobacterium RU_4_20]NJR68503.1 DUF3082 domain-containing protein [Synechococcales cyanobacterium CRU_2_2]
MNDLTSQDHLSTQDLPTPSVASQDDLAADGASAKPAPTPLQCLNGSAIAGVLAWGAYSLTHKISTNFAAHPFSSANYITVNISVAVRTLVVGVFALATGVFALTALGLLGLGIQTLVKKNTGNAGTVHTID